MAQIMGLPADKLLEDYTPGEKMAYTYTSGYQAAIADVLEIVFKKVHGDQLPPLVALIRSLLEDKT